jgi:hypothetical protein
MVCSRETLLFDRSGSLAQDKVADEPAVVLAGVGQRILRHPAAGVNPALIVSAGNRTFCS